MAKCPKCGSDWKWDWCQDTYRRTEDGEFATSKEFEDDKFSIEVNTCECGEPLGVTVFSKGEGDDTIINHPKWKDVDWEKECWEDC